MSKTNLKDDQWALQYCDAITETIYNRVISVLKELGMRPFLHCEFAHNYSTFKAQKWLRVNYGDGAGKNSYCIDNNPQEITTYITWEEILGEEKKEPFKDGDVVVILDKNWGTANEIGEIGKSTECSRGDSARVTVYGCASAGTYSPYASLRHATEEEKAAYNAGCKTLAAWQKKNSPAIAIYGSVTTSLDGFGVGERVKIVKVGSGLGSDFIGKETTIRELGIGKYSGQNGARIVEKYGNEQSGSFDKWIGLSSFGKIPASELKSSISEPAKEEPAYTGGGIVSPSKWGYKMGDRVEMTMIGYAEAGGLKNEGNCKKGDKGTITGVNGVYTEVLLDSGKYCVRSCVCREDKFKIINVMAPLKQADHPDVLVVDDSLRNTKIWIGLNTSLNSKVQEALFKRGCMWAGERVGKVERTDCVSLYIRNDLKISYSSKDTNMFGGGGEKKFHYEQGFREIFPIDLGIAVFTKDVPKYPETVSTSLPALRKFLIGDVVKICKSGEGENWGWQGTDGCGVEARVDGVGGVVAKIIEAKWNDGHKEWSYKLERNNTGSFMGGWVAEHVISLCKSEAKESGIGGWGYINGKPYVKRSDITYELITECPYFRTLTLEQLSIEIGGMNYDGYKALPGYDSVDKANVLFAKFKKMEPPISVQPFIPSLECVIMKESEEKQGMVRAVEQGLVAMKEPPIERIVTV